MSFSSVLSGGCCHRLVVLFGTCLLALCLASPGAQAQKPADIERLDRIAKLIESEIYTPTSDYGRKLVDGLTQHRLKVAKRQAKNRGYAGVIDLEDERLLKALRRSIKKAVDKALVVSSVTERRDLLYDALIDATSERLVDEVMAAHLGFDPPGDMVTVSPDEVQPDIGTQVTLDSGSGKLVFVKEKTKLLKEVGGPGHDNAVLDAGEWVKLGFAVVNKSKLPYFSSSAFLSSESSCLWVPPEREYLFPEMAPARAEKEGLSGLLDGSPIIPSRVVDALESDGSEGTVESWVYLSQSCMDGQRATVKLVVRDTHRTPGSSHVLRARLLVRNRIKAKAVNFLVDHDVPGWSDGEGAPPIDGGRQFELSHAVSVDRSQLRRGHMGWGVQRDVKKLLDSDEFRSDEPMVFDPAGSNRLLAGDDYDLETIDGRSFGQMVQSMSQGLGWTEPSDARMLAATDVLLLYRDPNPNGSANRKATKTVKKTKKIEVTCQDGFDNDEDGKTDCADEDCAGEKICICGVAPPEPLSGDRLVKLFQQNSEIAPAPAAPAGDDAVSAVSVSGYELRFNERRFRKLYQCELDGIPPSKCGHPVCKDCDRKPAPPKIVTFTEEVPNDDAAGGESFIPYKFRYYFSVPVKWEKQTLREVCDNGRDDDEDGLIDCRDVQDCRNHPRCRPKKKKVECTPAPVEICDNGVDDTCNGDVDCADSSCSGEPICEASVTWLDVALGAGFHSYQPAGAGTEDLTMLGAQFRGTVAFPRLMNPRFVPLTLGMEFWVEGGGGNNLRSLGFQLGYVLELTPNVELQPHVGFQNFTSGIETLGGTDLNLKPEKTTGTSVGISLRIHPLDEPGFFFLIDLAYRKMSEELEHLGGDVDDVLDITDPGVSFEDDGDLDFTTLEPASVHLNLGLGYRF